MSSCKICNRNCPVDDVSLFRVNQYGIIGEWACQDHIHLFSDKIPSEKNS
jgi:hypothetical protein